MASRDKSRKQALRQYLDERKPDLIDEALWRGLLERLRPISEGYLRDLLRETGLPFDQPYAGVRQGSFQDLEDSLRGILEVYSAAVAASDRARARYCRRQVIAAKDRARFAMANGKTSAEKRAEKEEMAQWMLVWLENPPVFPAWVEARKAVRASK